MKLDIGDQVGVYVQPDPNAHQLEYRDGVVEDFINPRTVVVKTEKGVVTVALNALTKLFFK